MKQALDQENRPLTIWQGMLMVAVGLGLGFLLAEILCRVVNPLGISYFPETARYMDTLQLADGVGYRNQPNLRGTYWGAPVAINSVGLRDEEVPLPRPADEFRILVMGDSWPFGIGVDHEQTFSNRLQEILNKKASPGMHARTIDMGVPSYNTEAELAQYQIIGSKLQANLVVLMFTLNDIEPKMWIFNKRTRWYVNLAQRSYAASFLFRSLRDTMGDAMVGKSGNVRGDEMSGDYSKDNPRWIAIDESMTTLNKLVKSTGSPFMIFSEAGPNTAPGRLMSALCQREGIPLVVLNTDADPRWVGHQLHNSASDGHPNVEGNDSIAQVMYEELDRKGLLDPFLKAAH